MTRKELASSVELLRAWVREVKLTSPHKWLKESAKKVLEKS